MVKIKVNFDIYAKTNTQNGKEVVTHITHMMYGKEEGSYTVSHI